MKKFITFSLLLVLTILQVSAQQGGLFLFVDDAAPEVGQEVCIPITVKDFTDITEVGFTLRFDPDKLSFVRVQDLNTMLAGLVIGAGEDAVNISQVSEGIITFHWQEGTNQNCNSPGVNGITMDDGSVLFSVCVRPTIGYAESTTMFISGEPERMIALRKNNTNANCFNINPIPDEGTITVGVEPYILDVTESRGNVGDLVCVDVNVVGGWSNIKSVQFALDWDVEFMELVNVIPNDDIAANTLSSAYKVQPDELRVTWFHEVPGQDPITVPNGTLFFQACFRIVGDCEDFSSIGFKGIGRDFNIEVINNISTQDSTIIIPFQGQRGRITANTCNPTGLKLQADCASPVNFNDNVCIPIKAGNNFQGIQNLEFNITWNPNILTYATINNRNGSMAWVNGDFILDNTANGVLGIRYSNTPLPAITLPAGATLFNVCFDATGLGGSSPIMITTPAYVTTSTSGTTNIGINPTNCEQEIIQPAGVGMRVDGSEISLGGNVCIPIRVANFTDVLEYEFTLNYDNQVFSFVNTQNVALNGASITAPNDGGLLLFEWSSATPVTLDDDALLFEVCFTTSTMADPADCSDLSIIDLPLPPRAVTSDSNGENIGINTIDGDLCVLFPEGFGLIGGQATLGRGDTLCLPFRVVSFDNITGADFSVSFDPTQLMFVGFDDQGAWSGLSLSDVNSNVGSLRGTYSSGSALGIADSTIVFSACFVAIGDPECQTISLTSSASPAATTTNGEGSIVFEDGEICVEDRLFLEGFEILPPSCPGAMDGSIKLFVSGGEDPLGTSWNTNPPRFTPLEINGIGEGVISFTVFDDANPSLTLTDSVVVEAATQDLPEAVAGEDKTLNCSDNAMAVLSSTGSTGETFNWFRLGGGQPVPVPGNPALVSEVGLYQLVVTNGIGCSDLDTVRVLPAERPLAMAGPDAELTCAQDSVTLNTTGSTTGTDISYRWVRFVGGVPTDTLGSQAQLTVSEPGRYQLVVRSTITGCTSLDTVFIADNRSFPDALAGPNQVLSCDGTPITLDASGSQNPGRDVTFTWTDADGNVVGNGTTAEVTELGTYTVTVRETTTGCESTAQTAVLPNAGAPTITFIDSLDFTCLTDTIRLGAQVVGMGVVELTWRALNGGQLVPGGENTPNPRAVAPGSYELTALDASNRCTGIDTLVVMDLTTPPTAVAGEDVELDCNTTSVTLDGSGSATDGVSYAWSRNGSTQVIDSTLTLTVEGPGVYTLTVIDRQTGCVGTDAVEVTASLEVPRIDLDSLFTTLSCTVSEINLPAVVTPAGGNFEYIWEIIGTQGNIVSGADQASVTVNRAGMYQLTVRSTITGCEARDTATVLSDAQDLPSVVFARDTVPLGCATGEAILDGSGSAAGADITYEWIGPDGAIITDSTRATLVASAPGTYQLTVRNTLTECENSASLVVDGAGDGPAITAQSSNDIGCTDDQSNLTVAIENDPGNYVITWTRVDTTASDTLTGAGVTVTEAGTYEVMVTDISTGCVTTDTVSVIDNSGELPSVAIADAPAFDCQNNTVQLDASASGDPSDYSSISWTSRDGNTITPANGSLLVTVNGPGVYVLTLTATNGCAATDSITVAAAQDTPQAQAGEDQPLECGESVILSGRNSSQGANFTYRWTTSDGSLSGDVNSLMPTAEAAGTYVLQVTNTENGCTDQDSILITAVFPPNASVGNAVDVCGEVADISGNLPAGTTGRWTTTSTATIGDPTATQTQVSNLPAGTATFTWTLSAPGCPDYSEASIQVNKVADIIAVSDLVEMNSNDRFVEIDLAANDVLNGVTDYEITILTQPTLGAIDTLQNGILRYNAWPGLNGRVDFMYRICSRQCPDVCAEAMVVIDIDTDGLPDLPNTITPNGDGMNDLFVVDLLLNQPANVYPDNELIIFNRWGDIVYQIKPYDNQWGGENQNGGLLPEGTYYYVLRLNIGEGVILRGDITIIR